MLRTVLLASMLHLLLAVAVPVLGGEQPQYTQASNPEGESRVSTLYVRLAVCRCETLNAGFLDGNKYPPFWNT